MNTPSGLEAPKLPVTSRRNRSVKLRKFRESLIFSSLVLCAAFSILVTTSIVYILFSESFHFFTEFEEVSLWGYLSGLEWNPLLGADKKFGMWPLVTGTLMVTAISAIISLPIGLLTAVYLSEYAPPRVRAVLKPVLEVLAGIPTVVYGFFALAVITPALRSGSEAFTGDRIFEYFNSTSAGIAVGILCLPTVCSLSEDALRAVPRSLREGADVLGATKFDVSVKGVVPAALSGVIAAFLLAIARAIGETMIVALAAGGISQGTIRLSIGLEDADALIADLKRALKAAEKQARKAGA